MKRGTIEDLRDTLQPIGAELGLEAAEALAHHFGGQRIYIQPTISEASPLLALGDAAAAALCRLFGGERLDVPLDPYRPEAYRRWVAELGSAGRTVNEIARELGLSYRSVQIMRSGTGAARSGRQPKRDPRQMDLLDKV